MNVRLTPEQKIKVLTSGDMYQVMRQILLRENKIGRNKEHFWVVCLSSSNRILMIELISLGSVNKTIAEPMDVFSFALQKRAVQMILVHNHPSGETKPSRSDYQLTEKMVSIGRFLQLPVIDHLIITENDYTSFEDEGLIQKINTDNNYDLTFANITPLLQQMEDMEKKQQREMLKAKKEIAKRALEEGMSIEQVVKISGLTKKQVEALKK